MVYQKKGRMNNKIELHMPSFDTDDLESNEENYEKIRDEGTLNRKNSVESQFLLDINLDVKQTSKPFCFSESKYER